MKQKYEKTVLNITRFTGEDVIATSEIDRHNAYRSIDELNDKGKMIRPNP